jgi:hypothetical protein
VKTVEKAPWLAVNVDQGHSTQDVAEVRRLEIVAAGVVSLVMV